jgi:hypothetical protein
VHAAEVLAAPACVIVNWDDPPVQLTVIRPVRASVAAFALTEYPRAAVSEPEEFDTVIQLESDWAVHAQVPADRETLTLDAPPSAATDCDVDDKV